MQKFLIIIYALFIGVAMAETINITWHNADGTTYDTTTCNVDAPLVLPTPPTKPGYTFKGWRSDKYDISTLDPSINGINTGASDIASASIYTDFSYGRLYATYICSVTPGTKQWNRGFPDTDTEGVYCWWKITNYLSFSDNIMYTISPSYTTFFYTYQSISQCKEYCRYWLDSYVKNNATTRTSLFGL